MNLQGKTVCFLGDSITQGCGASDEQTKGYAGLFAAAHPEATVHNCGICGTRIADQRVVDPARPPSFENPFYGRVKDMPAVADLVCVFGGTNDFGHGDAPMGKPGDTAPATFYGALYALTKNLSEKYPDARIVFFTPLHRSDEAIPTHRDDGDFVLADYAAAIKENAAYWAAPVLDLRSVAGMQPSFPLHCERFMPDGLHPNDAGYVRLFSVVDAFIAAL